MAEEANVEDILNRTMDIVLNAVKNKSEDDEKLRVCVRAFVHDVSIKAIKVKNGASGPYDKEVLESQVYTNFPELRELFKQL